MSDACGGAGDRHRRGSDARTGRVRWAPRAARCYPVRPVLSISCSCHGGRGGLHPVELRRWAGFQTLAVGHMLRAQPHAAVRLRSALDLEMSGFGGMAKQKDTFKYTGSQRPSVVTPKRKV